MPEPTIIYKEKPNTKAELDRVLNPLVKEWFYNKFPEYSLPQLYGVLEIHSRNNILVSAPTGATKTLTGFLSILNELVDAAQKGILKDQIYATYISPLKALNEDIKHNLLEPLEEIKKLASDKHGIEIDIRVAVRGGDTTQSEKTKMLKKPPHILITTPESLAILMSTIKFIENLKSVQWVIIDEIHALAENKRGTHLALSIERLEHLCGHITRVGLSATVSPLEEVAKFLVGNDRACKIVNVQFIKDLDLKVLSAADNLVDISYKDLHKKTYELIHDLIQKHKTTLIFTNTRAATERIVHYLKEMFPREYHDNNIGAHHGSLSKEHRHSLEKRLREGKMKVGVCSTSLELGIDIGAIDLVICLGSPKTVARTLQRVGRAGHQLHATTKGRIVVMDRDDLVECCVILKNAIEKKIDELHIPTNSLDVLAQQILGSAIQAVWDENELYHLIKNTYPYKDLKRDDFEALLNYLAGEYAQLEDRRVYAKIWRKEGKIGKRGRLTRIIYMTNIGTIPSQSGVQVKVGNQVVGMIDEGFLERLRKRDVFVLGGSTYEFRYARGMVATVDVSIGKPPTVPSWASEMLPLSFDLAMDISRFRRLMEEKFQKKLKKSEMLKFINTYLYVDDKAAKAIYSYLKEHFDYTMMPHDKRIVVEHYKDERGKRMIFHTLYGRRVNDCLSRAVAYVISKLEKSDVEIGVNDNGFYIATEKNVNLGDVWKTLTTSDLHQIMDLALEQTEVLKRRFRHCAERSLMILRNYMGKTKRVGKQQVMSTVLISAIQGISKDFPILKEAKREVLEDLMDIKNTKVVLTQIKEGTIKIEETNTIIPSPFAFQLVLQGYSDILKIDDKIDFLKRMHQMVVAKIALNKGKKGGEIDFALPAIEITSSDQNDFENYIKDLKKKGKIEKKLAEQLETLDERYPLEVKRTIGRMIEGKAFDIAIIKKLHNHKSLILKKWPKDLGRFVIEKAQSDFTYQEMWDEKEKDTKEEDYQELLLEQFREVHKQIDLEPIIYFELEKFIQNPKGAFDKKFKKWLNEVLEPPIPKLWPKQLVDYMVDNSKYVK